MGKRTVLGILSIMLLVLGGWAMAASLMSSSVIVEYDPVGPPVPPVDLPVAPTRSPGLFYVDYSSVIAFLIWGVISVALIAIGLFMQNWERWRFRLGVVFISVAGVMGLVSLSIPYVMLNTGGSLASGEFMRLGWIALLGVLLLVCGIYLIKKDKRARLTVCTRT